MRTILAAAVAVAIVALPGCGRHSAGTNRAAPPPATTTGILPPGVPTEGSRPSADSLPGAAEPQSAPPQLAAVPGITVPVGSAPEGIVADAQTRTVAVATRNPDELVLLDADSGTVRGRVRLPGAVRHLQLSALGGPVLVPVETANALLRVTLPNGVATAPVVTGTAAHDATAASDGDVFVANELGGTVAVLRGDNVVKVFTDTVQPAGTASVGNTVGTIDARQNKLIVYDVDNLTIVGSAPAGAGPTHLVADRHGRLIAADTRGDTVRLFEPVPAPREVASVAQLGGPYGIAYDGARDRLWVASSGTNEVLGYDLGAPNPTVVQRFPTIQNPYSIAADTTTGKLFVAGVTSGMVQVIDTAAPAR